MSSSKTILFNDIKSRLLNDVPGANNENLIKTSALWNEQLNEEVEKLEHAFNFPAVFIEFGDVVWIDKTDGLQEGQLLITLHQGFHVLEDEKITVLDDIDLIYRALQGFVNPLNPGCYSKLKRVAERQPLNFGNVQDWEVDFMTTVTDTSGLRKNKLIPTGAPIDLELNSELQIDPDTKPGIRTKDKID